MQEAEVIMLVRAGEIDAFTDIVEQYQSPIIRYLYRLTGDYEAARDLAQDTFIQAYKGILKTDSALSFRAWLYRIATNIALQHFRSKRIRSFLPFTPKEEQYLSYDNTDTHDEAMSIEQALHKIPEKQRTYMVLHFIEGFKYREIAETLGVSEESVRKRISRGRQQFIRFYRGGDVA